MASMAFCEKVLIAGFSASGKTSLLQALKVQSPEEWDYFDDLDQLVLKNRGRGFKTLAELIAAKGWEAFRLYERQEFESWIKNDGKGVLALGGGSLSPQLYDLYGNHRKLKFVHLSIPFYVAWDRLQLDSEVRPLLQVGRIELENIYHERTKIFDKILWRLDGTRNLTDLAREFWAYLA
jgi:shikimate kinase